jgi:hypothetical protein
VRKKFGCAGAFAFEEGCKSQPRAAVPQELLLLLAHNNFRESGPSPYFSKAFTEVKITRLRASP